MGNVWFTSDLHIGHTKVAELRATPAVKLTWPDRPDLWTHWHDGVLATGWDTMVGADDTVWILGDISAGGKAAQVNALTWLAQRPGIKHLVTGNHDGCHPMYRNAAKCAAWYLSCGIASVQPFARRKVAGRNVLMSHFPYSGDHTANDRYTQYRLRNEGVPLLHGHTHTREKVSLHVAPEPRATQVHVGIDAWGLRPVHLDEIAQLIEAVE